MQAIQMSLMPEVLGRGQLHINTLRLENYANLPPQIVRITRDIEAHDRSASPDRNHQRGEDAKQRGLAAAIGSQQPEKFGVTNIKRHAVQSSAVAVMMNNILDRNHGGRDGDFGIRAGYSEWSFGGHSLFYDEKLSLGLRSDRFSCSVWNGFFKRYRNVPPHLNGENNRSREQQRSDCDVSDGGNHHRGLGLDGIADPSHASEKSHKTKAKLHDHQRDQSN